MTSETWYGDGAYGHSAAEWEQRLAQALERGDHAGLKDTLLAMRQEMQGEVGELGRFGRAPLLDRLTEHARRLLRSEPTAIEALEQELAAERKAWIDFRRRYRQSFVPADLHPFLRSCAVFIESDPGGVQFEGFGKFTGRSDGPHREAVTLFVRTADPPVEEEGYVPPNFFSFFDEARGEFEVRRAYRTVLPRGGGTDCVHEHLTVLVRDLGRLRRFGFDDVQNRPTYGAYVTSGDPPRLREPSAIDATPLGRLAQRVLSRVGMEPVEAEPALDPFGALDLAFPVRRA